MAYVETMIAVAGVVTLGAGALYLARDATADTSRREAICISSGFEDCALGGGAPLPGAPPWSPPPPWTPARAPTFDPTPSVSIDLGGGTDDGIAPAKFKYTKAKCLCAGGPQCPGAIEVDVDPPSKDHDVCTQFVKQACAACPSGCESAARGCS